MIQVSNKAYDYFMEMVKAGGTGSKKVSYHSAILIHHLDGEMGYFFDVLPMQHYIDEELDDIADIFI